MTARSVLLASALWLEMILPCLAAIPPRAGHVNDHAGLLSPETRVTLEHRLDAFCNASGMDVAILVLRALDIGDDRRTYAHDVFEAWRIGAPGRENGLLLVVALQDRLIVTQQNTLTPQDDLQGVVRNTIIPAFRDGHPTMGLEHGIDALLATLLRKPLPFAGTPRSLWATWLLAAIVALLAVIPWMRRSVGGPPRSEPLFPIMAPACFLLLASIFLVPPFQVPDEPNHLYRAWQVSRGGWTGALQGGQSGGEIPRCLVRTVCGVTDDVTFYPHHKFDRHWLTDDWFAPFDYRSTVFYDFSNSAVQSPVTYLPQAVGVAAGRWLGLPPLGLLYAARLANALVGMVLLWLAVRLAPRMGAFLLIAAWMPMTAHLTGSVSPDALTNALAFIFPALVFRACERGPSRAVWGGLFVAGMALGFCKLVYTPLTVLALAVPLSTCRQSMRAWIPAVGVVLASMVAALLWGPFGARAFEPIVPSGFASVGDAWNAMLADPLHYVAVAWNTLHAKGLFAAVSMIGVLGHIDTPLPSWFLLVYGGLLAVAAVATPLPTGLARISVRVGALVLAVGIIGLVFAVQCVTWLPAGALVLEGHQGRYFIPLLPLAAIMAGGWGCSARVPLRWAMPVAGSAAVISLGISIHTILCRYYWA